MKMRLMVAIIMIFLALGAMSLSFSSVLGGLIYLLLLLAIALVVIRFTKGIADVRNSDIKGS